MAELRFLPEAYRDLEEAVAWCQARSADAERNFCEAIDEGLDLILSNPSLYPRWDEHRHYYLLQRFPYYILYRVDGNVITVSEITHTSRDAAPSA
jgi:plasmid stabilization system protein ParE